MRKEKLNPNIKDLRGVPILAPVIEGNHLEMLEYLILARVNLNVKDPLRGSSMLHKAVSAGSQKAVEMMLLDPELDLETKNRGGWTPIAFALGKYPEIAAKLLQKGASVNVLSNEKKTFLSQAVAFEMDEEIEALFFFSG